jgi:hypothetical protein
MATALESLLEKRSKAAMSVGQGREPEIGQRVISRRDYLPPRKTRIFDHSLGEMPVFGLKRGNTLI